MAPSETSDTTVKKRLMNGRGQDALNDQVGSKSPLDSQMSTNNFGGPKLYS